MIGSFSCPLISGPILQTASSRCESFNRVRELRSGSDSKRVLVVPLVTFAIYLSQVLRLSLLTTECSELHSLIRFRSVSCCTVCLESRFLLGFPITATMSGIQEKEPAYTAEAFVSDSSVDGDGQDGIDMARMGKKQEFKRNFNWISSVGFTSCTMGT